MTLRRITSAYNFAPLSREVVTPDWQHLVSQDMPLQEGLCAELELELEAHTPLLVGDERSGLGPKHPVEFFRHPDGVPAIPGSSLRGLLRNVLEIATCARLAPLIDDRALSLRDLNLATYREHLTRREGAAFAAKSRGGWLRFDVERQQWCIHECEVLRIFHTDIKLRPNGPGTPTWHEAFAHKWKAADADFKRLAETKYECTGGKVAVYYQADPTPKAHPHSDGKSLYYRRVNRLCGSDGATGTGYIVLTGQPAGLTGPSDFHKPGTKHIEFIFDSKVRTVHQIAPEVVRQFHEVHVDSSDLRYLSSARSPHAKRGIPVFFLLDQRGNQVSSLGLAQMYRLPGPKTLGQIAAGQQAPVRTERPLDFVQTLFGHVTPSAEGEARAEGGALKGRIFVGDLRWQPQSASDAAPLAEPRFQRETVLATPKPSFYPNYLEQSRERQSGAELRLAPYSSILDPQARLRGWKRYPVRPLDQVQLLTPPVEKAPSNSTLRPLAPGVTFRGRLRLHNVRLEELGAVLWALNFGSAPAGEPGALRHALGMGKPFGFGQVSLRLHSHLQVRPNDLQRDAPDAAQAVAAFEAYMARQVPRWPLTEALQELRAMADPSHPAARAGTLTPLKLAVGVKGGNEFVEAKRKENGFVLPRYSQLKAESPDQQSDAPSPAHKPANRNPR